MANIDIIETNKIKPGGVDSKGIYYGSEESNYVVLSDVNKNLTVLYDKVKYDFTIKDLASTVPANGGTYTISATTSKKTHGNGIEENIIFSPTTITIPANTGSSYSSSITITQATSNLTDEYNYSVEGDYVTSITLTLGTPSVIPASGGTINSCSYTVKANYKSGRSNVDVTASATLNWTGVTASSKGTTVSEITTVGTLYATASFGGKTSSANKSVTQQANAITNVSITDISVNQYGTSGSSCPVNGGTCTVNGGVVTVTYTSKATNHPTATKTVSANSEQSGISGSINGSTVTIPNLGTNYTTGVSYYIVTYCYNGTNKTCEIYQGRNVNPNWQISYTSTNASVVTPLSTSFGDANIIENNYDSVNNKGTILFDRAVSIIGTQAFSGCINLSNITIPNSVTSIGNGAFKSCSSLTTATIGSGVTTIGNSAFSRCNNLSNIIIPNSVTSIGDSAFSSCSSLTTATIGSGVTTIGNSAFTSCSSLSSITIPNSVTSIGSSAFYNCTSLSSITIPNSVTSISFRAFQGCTSLSSITIPNSVTSIGSNVFNNCTGLTSINIPNSVTSIGNNAFYRCSSLSSITIPNSVTTIGDYAFRYCYSLTSITIPNSVTTIGDYAFENCSNLSSILLESMSPCTLKGHVFDNTNSCPIYVPAPSINDYKNATNWSGYASRIYEIPNRIYYKTTGGTISDKFNKTSIFGTGLTLISNTYENGYGIAKYSGNVTQIAASSFTEQYIIKSLYLPTTVTFIGEQAFVNCRSLINISLGDGLLSIENHVFYQCSSLTNINIPNSVTSIGTGVFMYCYNLSSVTIGSGVTTIGDYAFYSNSNLSSITIPSSVTSIGYVAFSSCSRLTTATIGSGVTTIGVKAFDSCSSLSSITIPNSVTSIGNGAFSGCTSLTTATLGSGVTSIENSVFYNCTGLTSINIIGNSVTSIRNEAFRYCRSLSSITIPNSVTSIGNYAFDSCSSLSSITIPNSVTSIGIWAFAVISSLTTFICEAITPPTTDGEFLGSVSYANVTIYVPASSVNAYKSATNWRIYADKIQAIPTT